jgi:hypothetical protein
MRRGAPDGSTFSHISRQALVAGAELFDLQAVLRVFSGLMHRGRLEGR